MSVSLLPTFITPALTDLTVEFLKRQNIQLLMLDFDNTIVPYTTNVPTEKMDTWLKQMVAAGISICVVSNSHKDRVPTFCRAYGIDCITHARKPFTDGIRRCLARYGMQPQNCALVGDQIFTDTLGANCAGVRSILVNAIDNHTWYLKLRHVAELPFIYLARKRRISL